MAVDALPFAHPLRVGMIGSYGNRWANLAIARSDLLSGAGKPPRCSGNCSPHTASFRDGRAIYHVDCEAGEINNRVLGCHCHPGLPERLPRGRTGGARSWRPGAGGRPAGVVGYGRDRRRTTAPPTIRADRQAGPGTRAGPSWAALGPARRPGLARPSLARGDPRGPMPLAGHGRAGRRPGDQSEPLHASAGAGGPPGRSWWTSASIRCGQLTRLEPGADQRFLTSGGMGVFGKHFQRY